VIQEPSRGVPIAFHGIVPYAPATPIRAMLMDQLPPRPANTVFGIEIDGRRSPRPGFNSIAEAEQAATGLIAQGRKVAIFDLVMGRIVKQL
jgi:hypothetical protein